MEILTSYLQQIEKLAAKEEISEPLKTVITKASRLASGKTKFQLWLMTDSSTKCKIVIWSIFSEVFC